MNPQSLKEANRLLTYNQQQMTNDRIGIVICPPTIFLLSLVVGRKSPVKFGAQNVFWENPVGPYTGEISPRMLKNSGVEYVIVGHSERRKYLSETDEMIRKKVAAVLKAGMTALLCIGEQQITNDQRPTTKEKNYVKNQLSKDLSLVVGHRSLVRNMVVAYEPVWAISTTRGVKECTPRYAVEMIRYIKAVLATRYGLPATKVLYGGSVNGKNIGGFAKEKIIDGVLVGGASLKKGEIKKIIKSASQ